MTTEPEARPVASWRHWLVALLSTIYLVAFCVLRLDLPVGDETGPSRVPTAATAAPARPDLAPRSRAPERVADGAGPADARSPARVSPRPRVAPSPAAPRRRARRIRTRSS